MSYSPLISVSFHPIDIDEQRIINNNSFKRNKTKKIVILLLVFLSIFLILLIIGMKLKTKLNETKKELFNSTIFENKKSNEKLSTTTKTSTEINSSICQLPLYPSYNKNGTGVAGIINSSAGDSLHLYYPTCIYLNSKQDIYIGNTGNLRIIKCSPNNTQEGVTSADDTGLLVMYPQIIYVNHQNDDLYILDYGTVYDRKRIYQVRYLPLNSTISQVTTLVNGSGVIGYGMDIDDNLNIYVSESSNHRVVKWLSPTYQQFIVVAGNGTEGSEMNQLSNPQGIYLDRINNDLYIADTSRIQLWPAGSITGQSVVKSGILYPKTIKRDCHGNLYVLESHTVKLFSPSVEVTGLEGIILVGVAYGYQEPQQSSAVDYFLNANDMYLDQKNGDLYIVDIQRQQVQKFTINGELVPGGK